MSIGIIGAGGLPRGHWLDQDLNSVRRRTVRGEGELRLKIAPTGKLLHIFEIAAGDGTINVAFGPGEKELYVTVVRSPNGPRSVGEIVRIPNVEQAPKSSLLVGTVAVSTRRRVAAVTQPHFGNVIVLKPARRRTVSRTTNT